VELLDDLISELRLAIKISNLTHLQVDFELFDLGDSVVGRVEVCDESFVHGFETSDQSSISKIENFPPERFVQSEPVRSVRRRESNSSERIVAEQSSRLTDVRSGDV